MAMDEARKKELNRLHWESKALLDALADRLPDDVLARLRAYSDAGDWTELVDGLCAELVQRRVEVTAAERDALAGVLDLFQTPKAAQFTHVNDAKGTVEALNVAE